MAKLKSLIKIEGTLDDLTFYKGDDGYLVRTKGGVDGNRIKTDPKFARTRENGREFANIAKSGKLLRRAIKVMLKDANDNRVTSRLTKTMAMIKNSDLSSNRGERNVASGIASLEGKEYLKGFDFNQNALLDTVLERDYVLDMATGELTMNGLIPNDDIEKPQGATHVTFRSMYLNLDFETKQKVVHLSNSVNLAIDNVATDVLLQANIPNGTGAFIYLLNLTFFQEINGEQYPLNNGAFNALQIIEVM